MRNARRLATVPAAGGAGIGLQLASGFQAIQKIAIVHASLGGHLENPSFRRFQNNCSSVAIPSLGIACAKRSRRKQICLGGST
jgi:hypothetical protein